MISQRRRLAILSGGNRDMSQYFVNDPPTAGTHLFGENFSTRIVERVRSQTALQKSTMLCQAKADAGSHREHASSIVSKQLESKTTGGKSTDFSVRSLAPRRERPGESIPVRVKRSKQPYKVLDETSGSLSEAIRSPVPVMGSGQPQAPQHHMPALLTSMGLRLTPPPPPTGESSSHRTHTMGISQLESGDHRSLGTLDGGGIQHPISHYAASTSRASPSSVFTRRGIGSA